MIDMELDRFRLNTHLHEVQGALATATVTYTIPIGYACYLRWGSIIHDDPAGLTVYWVLTRGALNYPLHEPVALAINVRDQLYYRVDCKGPLLLRYGDGISVYSTAAPAAGKRMTMRLDMEELIGETA